MAKVAIVTSSPSQAAIIERQLRDVVSQELNRDLYFCRFEPAGEEKAMAWLDRQGLAIFGDGTSFAEANALAKDFRSPRLRIMFIAASQLELTRHPLVLPSVAVTGEILFHALHPALLPAHAAE